ncbi:MAG: hypothetical protein RIQ94_865 [Pseudomonadota bacterium]|jgi:putative two-component system hydrogenase maturation factor HypX/HoxX
MLFTQSHDKKHNTVKLEKVLLVSTAFNGLTQRVFLELKDMGLDVAYVTHNGNDARLIQYVNQYAPDIIICPFLIKKIPDEIYKNRCCIIVHPGIVGDRSASSLDWMILRGDREWGCTLLQADDEMDAGDIWISTNFKTRMATKSSIYNREITKVAIESLLTMLILFRTGNYKPYPLDYQNINTKGQYQPFIKQVNRQINWEKDSTSEIVKKIRSADGSPGILDEIKGQQYYLFNAHKSSEFNDSWIPGDVVAHSCGAILRAAIDGAVWIGYLKPKIEKSIKLQATRHLHFEETLIEEIRIDYTLEGKQLPVQEVWFETKAKIAYLHFAFHNGAMSTEQGELLLEVYQHINTLDLKKIILMGGEDYFSNGVHLNTIEAAQNPEQESLNNINSINNVVSAIIKTTDKITISALSGNASADGCFLARAADYMVCRKGVVLNPHYQNMGLTGSECSTRLSQYVGEEKAAQILEGCQPMGTLEAEEIGLIDYVFSEDHDVFYSNLKAFVEGLHPETGFVEFINNKKNLLTKEESIKSINERLADELVIMKKDFSSEKYNQARYRFVHKLTCDTPLTCLSIPVMS